MSDYRDYRKKSILSLEQLETIIPVEIKKYFTSQNVIDDYHLFLNKEVAQMLDIPDFSTADIKIFLTAYMVRFCPEEVMDSPDSNPKKKKLIEAAKKATNFFEQFKSHIKKETNDIKIRRMCGGMISQYKCAFKAWQKVDNDELVQILKISYHNIKYSLNEFERHQEKVENSPDHHEIMTCMEHMMESMGKIKRQYIHARRRNGVLEEQALEELEKITAKELHMTLLDLEEMILGAQNAFWDNFKKELAKDDFSRLPEILNSIKGALISILHKTRRTETDRVHNQLESSLDENFDIDFIKQMIDNNVFEPHQLIGYVNYLSSVIKNLQAPEDDVRLEQWQKEVHKKLQSDPETNEPFTYSEVLPNIMRDIFQHISLINKRLENLQ